VLGLRDVVDPPEKVRRDWGRDGLFDVIERYYRRVLIYGVPEVLDAVEAYGLSPAVAARLSYCGYVTEDNPRPHVPDDIRKELGADGKFIIATCGGGGDGRPLLGAFLGALEGLPDWRAVVVTGEFMAPEDREALQRTAAACGRVILREHLSELPAVMAAAELVVAMGGYNTSAEILATGARAVLVPRVWRSGEHGERGKTGVDAEQLVRAEGLARMGAVDMVDPRQLSPATLRAAMERALGRTRPTAAAGLQLDGAARVAESLLDVADDRSEMV
jgi:predicted glycosyltransferase